MSAPERLLAALLALAMLSLAGPARAAESKASPFVGTDGTRFVLDGREFRVAGVNNHYLTFGSDEELRRVLDDAVAMNANVVRTFIQPVIGSLDGSVPTIFDRSSQSQSSDLGTKGRFMLAWDPVAKAMVANDGPDGLVRLDTVVAEARKRGLRLIVAFLDFWAYTGGAQQIGAWYGSTDKYTFFAQDPRTRQVYKDWVAHILARTNSITGVRYSDDPTIFAWDLMNEPDIHPAPLLREWLVEMSGFVKSRAPRQLLASGHANMKAPLTELTIPTIDFGTWHGYADYTKLTHDQFDGLIREFCTTARHYGKPVLLEEFGLRRSDPDQAGAFRTWLGTMRTDPDCAGWVVWRLVGRQDGGAFPVDEHDQFDIRNDGGEVWTVFREGAAAMRDSVPAAQGRP